jgi:viroplasmin and RNaseH domain-containing protein
MAKAKQKYYAIKSGQDPKTKTSVGGLILESWAEAEPYVKGVKGAEYKSFPTLPEAEAYLQGDSGSVSLYLEMQPDVLYCYVDGSFNKDIPNYSFGLCCVKNGKVVHMDKGQGNNPDAIEMQQIGGELLGAINALRYAKSEGHTKVVILHDYMGVANHATGTWKRTNAFSTIYYNWMQNFFRSNPVMKVNFLKVDAHTGNDFNEIADGLAKLALGIKPDAIFYRMLEKHGLTLKE